MTGLCYDLPSLVLSQWSPRNTLFFQKQSQSWLPGPRGSQPFYTGPLRVCVSSRPRILPGT